MNPARSYDTATEKKSMAKQPTRRGFLTEVLGVTRDVIVALVLGTLVATPFLGLRVWTKYPIGLRITVTPGQAAGDLTTLRETLRHLPGVHSLNAYIEGASVIVELQGARIPWERALRVAEQQGYRLNGYSVSGVEPGLLSQTLGFLLIVGPPVGFGLVYLWRRRRGQAKALHVLFRRPGWRTLAIGCLLTSTGVIGISALVLWLQQQVGIQPPDPSLLRGLLGPTWWSLGLAVLMVVIIVPLMEEIFFRGYIFDTLVDHSKIAAYLISSALFAILHLEPVTMIPLFFMGIVLAYGYRRTGNLAVSVVAHTVNNLVAVVATYIAYVAD
ncbi:MAG: CPBP family intramembrane metalloprotease [Blastocatellia bacterium]|nr:CPBP family intramembrane metalloprotease [Blastocatellia bacterium]